jgi:hypothetical protein
MLQRLGVQAMMHVQASVRANLPRAFCSELFNHIWIGIMSWDPNGL